MNSTKIPLAQFFVKGKGEENLAVVKDFIDRAYAAGAKLLVLPEGIIARKPGFGSWSRDHAETLDLNFPDRLPLIDTPISCELATL